MSNQYVLRKKIVVSLLGALLVGCGSSNDTPSTDQTSTPKPANPATTVQISGKITFDSVPAVAAKNPDGTWNAYLDYAHTARKPARSVIVELIDAQGTALDATSSDDQGNYVFSKAPAQTPAVHIRVKAQMLKVADQGGGPAWNFAVRDNTSKEYGTTSNAALYAVDGQPFDIGTSAVVKNENAPSGWNPTAQDYTSPRAAGPFAILDTVYAAREKVRAVAPNLAFPPLNIYWSPVSKVSGSSFYNAKNDDPSNSSPENTYLTGLYIKAQKNVDTDEYDSGLVAHEWGHYFQAKFSRDDSIAGEHGANDIIDMRVSFSEGWGNAFSSMARNDPMYIDTLGPQQSQPSVVFNINDIDAEDPLGWFSETAIQSVLFRLSQSADVGFAPIYKAMTTLKQDPAFTSIFPFVKSLRGLLNSNGKSVLDNLLAEIGVSGGATLDGFGTNQTTVPAAVEGQKDKVLPIYTSLIANQPKTICTTTAYGKENKLGNYRFLRFNITHAGPQTLKIQTKNANLPALEVLSNGTTVTGQVHEDPNSATNNTVTFDYLAAKNDYVAALTADMGDEHMGANECFTVTLAGAQ